YWNRDPNMWGSLNDWNIYFIEKVNRFTKHDSYRSLYFELNILLTDFPEHITVPCGCYRATTVAEGKMFLPEVGSMLWSGFPNPIIICVEGKMFSCPKWE
ncbi:35395_t:CDS:2, partial [Racocetra persica]